MSRAADRRPGLTWPLAIPLVLGLALMLVGASVAAPTIAFVARATVVTGTYAGSIARVGGSHGATFLYPQFRYHVAPGRPDRLVTATGGASDQPWAPGEVTRVFVDPADPDRAMVGGFANLWLGPAFAALMGAVLAGIPLAIVRVRRTVEARRRHG